MREECLQVVLVLFADESRGSVDELAEVLDTIGAVLFVPVVGHQPAFLEHDLHRFGQGQSARFRLQRFDDAHERRDRRPRLAREPGGGLVQADRARLGGVLQLLQGAGADASRREINDAEKSGVVVRVRAEAQVGERMLDFQTLEKAQAPVDAVREALREQRVLDHPRLGVGPVEDADVG